MLTGMATQAPDYVDAGMKSFCQLLTHQTASPGQFRTVGYDCLAGQHLSIERTEEMLSHATFLYRQALYLRPDPARVIVRPFKPATEPRDLNPTDKTRANHIGERVLALDPKVAAHQLAEVLENFQ